MPPPKKKKNKNKIKITKQINQTKQIPCQAAGH